MNTNSLKKFAQEARKKLITQVGSRLDYVLGADSAELRERAAQVKKLNDEIARASREQVIEKVAYIWFNRLMALRFMDANDYQPIGIRVVTPRDGFTTPEILEEAKSGQLPAELPVDTTRIQELLDGKIPSANPQNEVYKLLLIAACNHLHKALPFLFERIDDYTDLLIPDDLTSEFSIVHHVRAGMSLDDCNEVEIIGWLYQFYISEKKDEVFASKAAVKKEDIPAATQLFTPRWIVEYMVQNTVGKLWMQNRPASSLREHMPYYIESPSAKTDDFLKITSVEDIKLLDQACGSGHILVYGFELFYKMYEEEGYNPSEIPRLIIEKNLFGFEIDERAAQLASMALMMKARSYYRRLFRNNLIPNILCYQDLTLSKSQISETFAHLGLPLTVELSHDLNNMAQATNLGSLILPHASLLELKNLLGSLTEKAQTLDILLSPNVERLVTALKQLLLLGDKYHCVVDNPPYMGSGKMNKQLSTWVKVQYPKSKADLMVCFMEAGLKMLHPKGYLGMINRHSWMFINSYETLRKHLISQTFFDTLLHLGPRAFPEIGGEVVQSVAFTFWNVQMDGEGQFIRLVDFDQSESKRIKMLEAVKDFNSGLLYSNNQKNFRTIPGHSIGYWLNSTVRNSFKNKRVRDFAKGKAGIVSGDDADFLKLWHEVSWRSIKLDSLNFEMDEVQKFVPINKGGTFRKYYGNKEYVINLWNLWTPGRTNKSVRRGDKKFYYQNAVTWTYVTTGKASFRVDSNSVFATAAPSLFFEDSDKLNYTLAFLNSKVSSLIIPALNPTTNLVSGDIANLPLIISEPRLETINVLTISQIQLSKSDWDSRETSWDFCQNAILNTKAFDLEEAFDLFTQHWSNKFFQFYRNEEQLNQFFIEIYALNKDLTADSPLDEVTILQQETKITNGQLVFDQQEVIAQFMSYAVGCMFGRYSLDQEGLILANQYESLEDFVTKVQKSEAELSFVPDADNVIPVLDEEWFEDDIVGRFHAFLKATFGTPNFAKNLAFVESSLGKDIRKYFVKDFYVDHIQRYKKRPIYWMFSSPKGSFNVLIYMHRYRRDTLSTILNNYLNQYREKLRGRLAHLEHIKESGSPVEQNKAIRESDKIKLVLLELQEYERDTLYPLASERIGIDLDDGVLVNYNKFGKAIKEVKGLNDKATKQKVREFNWIDTSQIR